MRGLFHLHLRKRMRATLEPFPARSAWKRGLDHLVIVVGIIGPVATIPQILKIYVQQQAAGVSALSWGTWAVLDIPWILYGLVHREWPIVTTYSLWLVINAIVCAGAIIYGNGAL